MNNKLQVWKRKLKKEERKRKMQMWDALSKEHRPILDSFVIDHDVESMYANHVISIDETMAFYKLDK